MWGTFKNSFDAWENATAQYVEQLMRSPLMLWPSGAMLSAATRAKANGDKALAQWWGAWGLPNKADQERTLHALNQLQSRLMDLEEKLEDLEAKER